MNTSPMPLLEISGLRISTRGASALHLVEDINLSVGRGETLGIVGESGSGKSISCQAALGILPSALEVTAGRVVFDDTELTHLDNRRLNHIRGRRIGVVFQNPLSSLNPALTVGHQIAEGLRVHKGLSRKRAWQRAVELLDVVRIPAPHLRVKNYPHEMSGGMAQRALIAMAIACEPDLLVADEPTTALDVTIQLQILDLLASLRDELGMALILVSHDLGVITRMCDRVAVMYAGQIVESGATNELFAQPAHPYTSALISSSAVNVAKGTSLTAIPGQVPRPRDFPTSACRFANRCAHAEPACVAEAPAWTPIREDRGTRCRRVAELELPGLREPDAASTAEPDLAAASSESVGDAALDVHQLVKHFAVRSSRGRRQVVHAVDDVNLSLRPGRILGLVGESGSGKSTVARLLLRLIDPSGGRVVVMGEDLARLKRNLLRKQRKHMQMVFQDPYGTLDPLMNVGQSIAEPMLVHFSMSAAKRRDRVFELLDRVGLDPSVADRRPAALSGGQRQRVAIARALALNPTLIVCDEAVSALDVSTRAQIINLIQGLKEREGIAFVFIAHDLATVHHVSDDIAVMYLGRVVEYGPADRVYLAPAHPYTRALLASVLRPGEHNEDSGHRAIGEIPSPIDPPSGCRFRTRCQFAVDICAAETPQPMPMPGGGWSACHLNTPSPEAAVILTAEGFS
ncbi:dipeptide ABC transporter ATP-binding protein [Sphaerimonospora thailandensis]|uniref:Oligopeptide ABC transporter ATP-binding protein OppF n=1 Tax=Sphaerimonospora thailandensis TaxID=795644 RepID=A0A8J3W0N5_9ACTN|nr:ABC transporter ATP-binding protein [Sphaerimonospora thailandensis]GIH72409.1 oligopeptide ABC transporter ATP-binding protein OppF [Sphaerimonospora thailandensis]